MITERITPDEIMRDLTLALASRARMVDTCLSGFTTDASLRKAQVLLLEIEQKARRLRTEINIKRKEVRSRI